MGVLDKFAAIVQKHEDLWSSLAQHQPDAMRDWMTHWDPWFSRWMQYLPRLTDSDTDLIGEAAQGLSQIREHAAKTGIPIPDLGSGHLGFVRDLGSGLQFISSGENMDTSATDLVPADFRAKCFAKISSDNVLTVKCSLGTGPQFERTVDLKPMIDYVHSHLVEYHRQLHGDTVVSGGLGDLLSDAINAVSSIVKDKTVQDLFNTATPIIETVVPGGTVIAAAVKIHDTIVSAKNGNASAGKALAGIKAAADAGDPAAASALDAAQKINKALNAKAAKAASSAASMVSSGLRIGASGRSSVGLADHRTNRTGSYENFVNTARQGAAAGPSQLALLQAVTGEKGAGQGVRSNVSTTPAPAAGANPYATNPYGDPYGGNPYGDPSQYGGYPPPPYPDPSQLGSPYGYPPPPPQYYAAPPIDPYNPYGTPMGNPYAYAPTPYGYTDPYSMGYSPSYYGGGYAPPMPMNYSSIPGHVPGDDYGGAANPYGYQFSGWGYNRPYRDNGGAGQGARSLYNLGLSTEPEKRELLKH